MDGPVSGSTLTILFWCFFGWEAVSNMSREFKNPRRDAIKGTIIAAVIVSIIYFFTALVVVGTRSYGSNMSDASLIYIIKNTFGTNGAIIAGVAALFICVAPAVAYIGAASRLACSLAESGFAPKPLSYRSKKYHTPLGGLVFLAVCFVILLVIFSSRILSLSTLIQIPNATFILTYIGGSVSGIILLRDSKMGLVVSISSLVISAAVFLFVKWTIFYPVIVTIIWLAYIVISKRFMIT